MTRQSDLERLRELAAGARLHKPMSAEELGKLTEAELENMADQQRRKLQGAGIPPRYYARTLTNFDGADPGRARVLETCKSYAKRISNHESNGAALLLIGPVGTGKTHLAIGMCREIMATGLRARYTTVYDLLLEVRSTYRSDAIRSEAEALKEFTKPALLVLDEVGNQRGTEDETIQMFRVINARYNSILPTVLISNLTVEELGTYIGAPALDRLREGGGKVLTCDWKSWRTRI